MFGYMTLFQRAVFDEIFKMSIFAIFWYLLQYKPSLNDMKNSEKLFIYEFYTIPKNDENTRIFILIIILHEDVFFNSFQFSGQTYSFKMTS